MSTNFTSNLGVIWDAGLEFLNRLQFTLSKSYISKSQALMGVSSNSHNFHINSLDYFRVALRTSLSLSLLFNFIFISTVSHFTHHIKQPSITLFMFKHYRKQSRRTYILVNQVSYFQAMTKHTIFPVFG